MQHTPEQGTRSHLSHLSRLILAALAAASLAACGGGGGSPGVGGDGSSATPGAGTGTVAEPKMDLALTDGAGVAVTSLSGGQSASVKATVLTAAGKPAVGAIVQFAAGTANLVSFTPETGSALTDANGVAVVTVKPASTTAAGAVAITGTAVVEGKTATFTRNITIGAAPLTVGTLSFSPAPAGRLPAFSTLSLNIPITSGGQPASAVSGLTMTSLCANNGTATLVPGSFANGIQVATYTNNGCLLGRDTITVSVGNSTQTIGVDVDAANIGSIRFAGSSVAGSSIVLKGSGGLGRSESAQLSFRVVDQHGNGLPGVDVNFSATTSTGGLTVSPARATTDNTGQVSTMVSSGTIPTPVRVIAEASRNGVTISGLSDALTISTGLPIQKSMSMSASKFNIEGLDYDGETTDITVRLADQYGNPVSDNTVINFVTEGGAIGSSAQGACVTVDGGCTVPLRSQAFKPLDGRITVLAYLQGIENFVDLNGDGQYSCTGYTGSTPYRPLVDACPSGGEPFPGPSTGQSGDLPDAFLDANANGTYEANAGDLPFPYNHSAYSAAADGKWGLNYIRRSFEIVFSGSEAAMVRQVCTAGSNGNPSCRDWTAADGDATVLQGLSGSSCRSVDLSFRLADRNNNPLPAGTKVGATDVSKVQVGTFFPDVVPSTNNAGGTIHTVTVKPEANCAAGDFLLQVVSPRGIGKSFRFKSA